MPGEDRVRPGGASRRGSDESTMLQPPPGEMYPLIQRTAGFRWWRPILGIVLLFLCFLVVAPTTFLPVLWAATALQERFGITVGSAFDDVTTPADLLYLNLTLASLTLIVWFIVLNLHRLRWSWTTSVVGRVRWKLFRACLALATVAVSAQLLVNWLLTEVFDVQDQVFEGSPAPFGTQTILFFVVIALTTPLQTIGEEYAFRGYLLQALGSLTRSPWLGILLSALVFAAAHGQQNLPLFIDRFAFGVLAAYLVVRTGGLEAGAALHILNNLAAFGLTTLLGDVTTVLRQTEVGWTNLLLTGTQNGVYLVLVLVVSKRLGVADRTSSAPSNGRRAGRVGSWHASTRADHRLPSQNIYDST